jgi:hypothetical protein
MCRLKRYLCQCCRFVYLPPLSLSFFNHICPAYYLPSTNNHAQDGGGQAHGSGRDILPVSRCQTVIQFVVHGMCRYCRETCVRQGSPAHVVIDERLEAGTFWADAWVVRFAHEVPQWEQPYQAQELLRCHYFSPEHELMARHFQSDLRRRVLDSLAAAA